ncbi:MAG TPA: polysaccharide biosynthesis C-terminal domain-containing protein [Polyangiaceae bacterium]|nr:polysaccharide biosynthesis C-terminal domain-containing protein [Polyangiaceae bacterium]
MSDAKAHDPARQAGALVIGSTLATIAAALTPLLVVRLIGKGDVARLLSVTLVYETIAMLLSTGFPYTLLYELSNRERPARAAIARRTFGLAALLGLGGALAVALVAGVLALHPFGYQPSVTLGKQLHLLLIFAPSLIADLPFRLLPNLLVAERQAQRSAALQVVRTILLTAATLVPLASEANVDLVIECSAIVRWGFGLCVPWELRRIYGGAARVPSPLTVAGLFAVAVPIGATEVVGQLNAQLDRWLVLLVLPATRLADYQAGAWQVPVISTIAYSVGAAYTPKLVERFQARDPRGALAIWRKNIEKTALMVVAPTMALVVGAEELMSVLFTRAYVDAADIFRFYAPLTFLRVAAYGPVIVAAGRPGLSLRAALFGLFWNALLSVPLLFTLGFFGPALGTGLAFILHVATYVYFIGVATGVPFSQIFPLRSYLRIFGLAALAGGVGFLVKRALAALPAAPLLVIEVAVVLAVFAALGLATGTLVREDFSFFASYLGRKKGARKSPA